MFETAIYLLFLVQKVKWERAMASLVPSPPSGYTPELDATSVFLQEIYNQLCRSECYLTFF